MAPRTEVTAAIAPVAVVVGEEEFLVDRAVRDLITAARAADLGGDIHDLDGAALGSGELESLTSPSLFGGGCVLIVRSAQNVGKDVAAELGGYAARPDPDVVLVLTHAGGAKGKDLLASVRAAGAQVIECPKVTRFSDRLSFVRAEFRRAGKRADDGAARALLDAIGSDLRELSAACDQLAADTEGQVDETVVARYYRGRAEATGFTVADRAVEGHLAQSLEQLRWALDTGVAPVLICSALAQGGARGRGGGTTVEDRPGPAAAAGLASAGHRPCAAGGRRSRRAGQGRGGQCRLRAGTRGPPDRRQPLRRARALTSRRKPPQHADDGTLSRGYPQRRSIAVGQAGAAQAGRRLKSARPANLSLLKLGVPLGDRRLAVRGLVLVDDALAGRLVQLPARRAQRGARLLEVPPVRGLAELTDGCPQ
jgi:DNA polymerase-3 subunit delta